MEAYSYEVDHRPARAQGRAVATPTVILVMRGATRAIEDAVEKILRSRASERATSNGPSNRLILIFSSAQDPTFQAYGAKAGVLDGDEFEFGGVAFRVGEV